MANDIEIGLSVQTNRGAQQAARQLRDIRDEQEQLSRAFRAGNIGADRFSSELKTLESKARRLETALDALERPRDIDVRTGNFDRVSRDVGLAGDVQSNLGAIGGLAEAANLPSAGGIAVGGELVALTEELPRLKVALEGLPATLQASAQAIGGAGFGLIGALGALTIAVVAAQKAADRGEKTFRGQIDAITESNRIAQTSTREQVQARIEELQLEKRIAEENKQLTQDFYELQQQEIQNNFNVLERGIVRLNAFLGIGREESASAALEASARATADAKDAANEAATELKAYERALNDSRLATEQTAQSEASAITNTASLTQTEDSLSNERERSTKAAQQAAETERKLAATRADSGRIVGRAPRVQEFGNFFGGDSAASSGSSQPQRDSALEQANDARRDALQRQNDIVNDFNAARVDAEIALQNDLARIDRQAARDSRQAARSRDFAAIFDLQERTGVERAEASIRANEQLNTQRRQAQRELDLLKNKMQQESRILNEGYRQSLNQTQQFANNMAQIFGQLNAQGSSDIGQIVRGELRAIAGS